MHRAQCTRCIALDAPSHRLRCTHASRSMHPCFVLDAPMLRPQSTRAPCSMHPCSALEAPVLRAGCTLASCPMHPCIEVNARVRNVPGIPAGQILHSGQNRPAWVGSMDSSAIGFDRRLAPRQPPCAYAAGQTVAADVRRLELVVTNFRSSLSLTLERRAPARRVVRSDLKLAEPVLGAPVASGWPGPAPRRRILLPSATWFRGR